MRFISFRFVFHPKKKIELICFTRISQSFIRLKSINWCAWIVESWNRKSHKFHEKYPFLTFADCPSNIQYWRVIQNFQLIWVEKKKHSTLNIERYIRIHIYYFCLSCLLELFQALTKHTHTLRKHSILFIFEVEINISKRNFYYEMLFQPKSICRLADLTANFIWEMGKLNEIWHFDEKFRVLINNNGIAFHKSDILYVAIIIILKMIGAIAIETWRRRRWWCISI